MVHACVFLTWERAPALSFNSFTLLTFQTFFFLLSLSHFYKFISYFMDASFLIFLKTYIIESSFEGFHDLILSLLIMFPLAPFSFFLLVFPFLSLPSCFFFFFFCLCLSAFHVGGFSYMSGCLVFLPFCLYLRLRQ